MNMQFLWRSVGCASLGAAVLLALSCELVVSPGSLQNGDCGAGRKVCTDPANGGPECVRLDEPDFQCASTACSPCALRNAVDTCDVAGNCAIGSCTQLTNHGEIVEEWTDCNGITADGCEVDILHGTGGGGGVVLDCGKCGQSCAAPHVEFNGCAAGACVSNGCVPGFFDCDQLAENGCESAEPCDGG
jgi:hypothetical protein